MCKILPQTWEGVEKGLRCITLSCVGCVALHLSLCYILFCSLFPLSCSWVSYKRRLTKTVHTVISAFTYLPLEGADIITCNTCTV